MSDGVGLYVEVHMSDGTPRETVESFVTSAIARGYTAGYEPSSPEMVELYVSWTDDQAEQATRLKQWIATFPFVRLRIIEYAYDHRQSRRG